MDYYENFPGWHGNYPLGVRDSLNAEMVKWVAGGVLSSQYDRVMYSAAHQHLFDLECASSTGFDRTRYKVFYAWVEDGHRDGLMILRTTGMPLPLAGADYVVLVTVEREAAVVADRWDANGTLTATVSIKPSSVAIVPTAHYNAYAKQEQFSIFLPEGAIQTAEPGRIDPA